MTVVVTWDDLVMGRPRWFMELCDALAEADLGIRIFTGGGKANMVTRDMAEKMARANFIRISYGIESGSQTILDEMQKQTTVEDNRRAIKVATDAGIFTHINIVLGMPSETERTLAETLEFLVGVVKENDLSARNISVAFATGYPGTQLFDHMLARGIVTDVRDYILSVSGVGIPDPILCDLSEEQLTSFLARLNNRVNDIHLARQGKHLRRAANRFINSACGRVAARFVPRKVKEHVLGLLK